MSPIKFMLVGCLAGVLLVMTSGWLITGHLCHRFQKSTPLTWRTENWRHHALATLWSAMGGSAFGALDGYVPWSHHSIAEALLFAALVWAAIGAPVIATLATYVKLHPMVVAGLLLEWLAFALGVSWACFLCSGR